MKNASFIVIFMIAEYLLKNSRLIICMMKMNAGLKKLAVTLTITAILLSFTQTNMKMVSSSDAARKIDVFTQKIPFNGKGINQSSDAFEPQELVILYALVTYNEAPIANKLVAFQANNPANAFQNITVVGVSSTNQSGIAQFSFRIPWPSENAEQIIFGEWSAIATVDIAEQVVVDTLTFQVGWIIKITKITTLNAKFEPQTRFLRGDIIVFDLTVENIALIPKSATIIIDAQDANSYPIIYVEMDNLVFQPGESHVRASSQIPTTAAIGDATVSAAAFTALPKIGGVLYSPAALSIFEIITAPVPVEKHDIAITSVSPLPLVAYIGTPIEITVEIFNLGDFTETFNVTTCYDTSKIATKKVWSMNPRLNLTMTFMLGTSNMSLGNYTIWAFAEFVPGEVNVANNIFIDGNVTLLPSPTHLLSIISCPISGVNFTINGAPARTTYLATHREGVYTIAFPSEWTDPTKGRRYIFNCWEDCSTNPTRTINLVSDRSLTAYYEEVEYTLTINTTIGGTTTPSPGSYKYPGSTSVTVTAIPDAGYEFGHWTLDGASRTENPITVVMDRNYTLTAYFKAVSTYTLSITSDPILGVDFTINGVKQATPYSATFEEKSYTIVMPASVTDSETGKVYNFRGWEDGSANLTRIVLLDRDTNLTAYYEETLKGWFVPVWFYWLLLLLLVLIIILLIIWFYRRRRKKAEEAFYSGWTAWYYCYDLRSKIRKI